MRKHILFTLLSAMVCAATLLTGCRTNENNYRKAYEKAVAENDRGVTEFENTIYNRYRAQTRDMTVEYDGKTFSTKYIRVKVTPDGGGINEWLRKYSVVVAEFKQLFNAKSMRNRYESAGYPRAFLVENAEPYYYVVVASSDNPAEMEALCDSIKAAPPVPLKDGFPYILQR